MNTMALLINLIFTWSFLLPAYLIRFVFVKKPVSKTISFIISAVVWLVQASVSIVVKDAQGIQNPKAGIALLLVSFFSYKILSLPSKSRVKKEETVNESIKKSSKELEKNSTFLGKVFSKKVFITILALLLIGFFITDYLGNKIKIAPTDKNQENSVVIDNLYRNTKYNFRIKFPKGWSITDGDGPNVVQKAFKDNRSINIIIKEFSSGVDQDWMINDIYSLENIKDEVISTFGSDASVSDVGETFLDNKPVLWAKFTRKYSALDAKVEGTFTQYYLLHNKILYVITIGSTVDDFNNAEPEFIKSISTFVIEDYENTNENDLNQDEFQTTKTFTKKSCGLQAGGEEIYTDWFKIDGDIWKIKISSEISSGEGISNTRVWYTTSSDSIMDEITQKKQSSYIEIGSGRPTNEDGSRYVEQEATGPGKYRLRIFCWNTNYSIEIQESKTQWKEYYLNQDKFKVSSPSKPSENNKSLNVLGIEMPYVEYRSSINNIDYYSSYIDVDKLYQKEYQISRETANSENIDFSKYSIGEDATGYYSTLTDIYDVLFNDRSGFREIEKTRTHFNGFYTIDYLWKNTREDLFIKGKIIIVGSKDVYLLSAESKNSDLSDNQYLNDYISFVNSWKPLGELSK